MRDSGALQDWAACNEKKRVMSPQDANPLGRSELYELGKTGLTPSSVRVLPWVNDARCHCPTKESDKGSAARFERVQTVMVAGRSH